MITFIDGPAQGKTLELHRTPIMLRVVKSTLTGEWDALDQLDDTPKASEEIHVYRMRPGSSGTVHVDYRDAKTGRRRGSWMKYAEYTLWPEQPADAIVRTNERWREWCNSLQQSELEKP